MFSDTLYEMDRNTERYMVERANIQYRAKEKDGAVKCWHTACDLQD